MLDILSIFDEAFDARMEGFETAIPGTVSAVNSDGTVNVRPSVRNVLKNMQMEPADSEGKLNAIPNVPVMRPGTAKASVVFELAEGDPVLLVSSSRDIGTWKEGGYSSGPFAPGSFGGCDLNSLVAVPCVPAGMDASPSVTVTVARDGSVTVESSSVTVKADSVKLDADEVSVTGTLSVDGGIESGGDVTANASSLPVSLASHKHAVPGITPGSGTATSAAPTPSAPTPGE